MLFTIPKIEIICTAKKASHSIDCSMFNSFQSPMKDFGYDISDFYDVDPIFGTLADLEELFEKATEKGIKMILDFVPNHSSDQHEWFKRSAKREQPYDDFYIWRNGKNNNKEPPNNWMSIFYGPAWTYNEERKQWYYHQFGKAINWCFNGSS